MIFDEPSAAGSDMGSRVAGQNLSTLKDSYTIWTMARSSLANGLGRVRQGVPVGESSNGLAIKRGLHAKQNSELQFEGGCDSFRTKARI